MIFKGMSEITSITFFYPSKIIGGAEYLFIRLAKVLSKNYGLDVNYIDFENGFARKILESDLIYINFITFSNFSKISLPSGTLIITPLSSIIDVLSYIKSDSNNRLLFWSIQPLGLKNVLKNYSRLINPVKNIELIKYKNSLNLLWKLKAICFMDGPNFYIQKDIFDFNISAPSFLPIPCQIGGLNIYRHMVDKNHINIGWLGRLSEEKTYSLINILDHANSFIQGNDITLTIHIIGEGEGLSLIDKEKYADLNIIFLGSLVEEALSCYLTHHVDLLFAMGTSALEGASLRLPTILVDFSYTPIPANNKFRWLYESVDFSLGDLYNSMTEYSHTFKDILSELDTKNFYYHGELCYNYAKVNHDIDEVALRLIKALNDTEMSVTDLKKTKFNQFKPLLWLMRQKNYLKYLWKKY